MKITAVETVPFRLPVRREFRWLNLQVALGGFVLVRVYTDEGLVGLGEATPLPDWGGDFHRRAGETQETVSVVVDRVLAPALLGRDPRDVTGASRAMDQVLQGHNYAKAAIDIALHDIWGKAAGLPLYRMLGGTVRDRVEVAHMIGLMPEDEVLNEAKGAYRDGCRAFQIKGGDDDDRDVRVVRALRAELGDDVWLRLDANQGYTTAKRALRVLRCLDGARLDAIEQPVIGPREMGLVTRGTDVMVIADESCWDPHDALEVACAGSVDAISIYLAKAGGIARAREVAAIARAAGMVCDVNGSLESGIGTAANVHFALATPAVSLPCVISVNSPEGKHPHQITGHYYSDDIITEPLPSQGGSLLPTHGPGLGIEIDEAKLELFRVH